MGDHITQQGNHIVLEGIYANMAGCESVTVEELPNLIVGLNTRAKELLDLIESEALPVDQRPKAFNAAGDFSLLAERLFKYVPAVPTESFDGFLKYIMSE